MARPSDAPATIDGDSDLLSAARRGCPLALGRLFELARGHLTTLAAADLPSAIRAKVAASDIVQETACDAHRAFADFDGVTQEEFFAWLRSILQHNVIDAVRRFEGSLKRDVRRETPLRTGEDLPAVHRNGHRPTALGRPPEMSAIRREDASAVTSAVDRLPDDYRLVLHLRYWDGLTFQQIGDRIGRSAEAVRKVWYRAVQRLQADLCEQSACDTPITQPMNR
jgi:RNA polymerase sigma-70 factor (ECF subfamily)